MVKKSTQKIIAQIQQCLANEPVTKAWLFGSYSRGEETPNSDVDILVQYDPNARVSLMTIASIMARLQDATNKQVDLVEDGCLIPSAVDSVNHDRIPIYERKG